MRAVVQRVLRASVTVDGAIVGSIGSGLLVYLGVGRGDDASASDYMVEKITNLRVFSDEEGRMNLSVRDVGGGLLVVSQFTLYGDVRRGRRPGFDAAMEPVEAERLYKHTVERFERAGVDVATGVFRADMHVESINDGPVTLLVDSERQF